MRLENTNVARTTAGTITVEFRGEGNDLITVRMSAEPGSADEAAIVRAKEMMAELVAAPSDRISPSAV
ncbi:hypothetical protein FHT78_001097 [Rhizobium sp. BK196]|jgi:hypothetical protein|uniref:hypothetical protein n=1 Tax=unclassified Rhizobium TaxID=2613769 RepID=UPI0016118CEB|nr:MULTISPECIES: hypothetical protein [unclassified Rhizobium]MBB3309368.1 hypothetical protein [Rhizobium sp. BK196]MBB3462260.1 hypothetical protein [Rhizobium sp. BK377]